MPVICVTELRCTCPIALNKFHMSFVPAVLVTVGIAVLSLTESTQIPSVSLNDKVVHACMYFVLAVAWMVPMALKRTQTTSNYFKSAVWVCLCATVYGALMEVLQRFCTLTRSGEMADLYADFIGAVAGVAVVWIFEISRSRHDDMTI